MDTHRGLRESANGQAGGAREGRQQLAPRADLRAALLAGLTDPAPRPLSMLVSGMPGLGLSGLLDGLGEALGPERRQLRVEGTRLGASEPFLALESLFAEPPTPGSHPATLIAQLRPRLAALPGVGTPVIVVHCSELLDPASVSLLCLLARSGEAQLLLGSYRPRANPEFLELLRSGLLSRHVLPALDPGEREAMIRGHFTEWVSPAVTSLLNVPGADSPMMLDAFVEHARQSGAVALLRGVWVPSGLPLTEPPQTRELVDAWLSRLSADERALLRRIGPTWWIGIEEAAELGFAEAADSLLGLGLLRYGRRGEQILVAANPIVMGRIAPAPVPANDITRLEAADRLANAGRWTESDLLLSQLPGVTAEEGWARALNAFTRGDVREAKRLVPITIARADAESVAGGDPAASAWYRLLGVSLLIEYQASPEDALGLLAELAESEAALGCEDAGNSVTLWCLAAARAQALRQLGRFTEVLELSEPDCPAPQGTGPAARRETLAARVFRQARAVALAASGQIEAALREHGSEGERRAPNRQAPLHDELFWSRLEVLAISGLWAEASALLAEARTRFPARQAQHGGLFDLVASGLAAFRGDGSESERLLTAALAQLERRDPSGVLPFARVLLGEITPEELAEGQRRLGAHGAASPTGLFRFFSLIRAANLPRAKRDRELLGLVTQLEAAGMSGSAFLVAVVGSGLLRRREGAGAGPGAAFRPILNRLAGTVDGPLVELVSALLRAEAGTGPDEATRLGARAEELGWTWSWQEAGASGAEEPAVTGSEAVAAPATVLTGREREIAERAAIGLSAREIAEQLSISARTVETHLLRAYRKLGVRSRAELRDALAGGRGV